MVEMGGNTAQKHQLPHRLRLFHGAADILGDFLCSFDNVARLELRRRNGHDRVSAREVKRGLISNVALDSREVGPRGELLWGFSEVPVECFDVDGKVLLGSLSEERADGGNGCLGARRRHSDGQSMRHDGCW